MSYVKERMYNPDLKEDFLNTYENEQTQKTLAHLFYKCKTTEEILGKDLYEFNIYELEEVLYNMTPLTRAVSVSHGRFISSYIEWAIEKGLLTSNINPLSTKTMDWYEKFVDKNRKIFFSESELEEIEKELVNASDAVILRLLFEGAEGEGLSELLNLTDKHIKENNILVLVNDDGGVRELKFSDKCINLVRAALNESKYHLKNGTSESRMSVVNLVENNFVIKTVERRAKSFDRADKHTVYRRIKTVKEFFNLQYLTAKSIKRSGMIKMAKDLYLRDGELDTKQFYEIADRFGVKKYSQGDFEYYNTTILKEFINRENILELYGIDIDK